MSELVVKTFVFKNEKHWQEFYAQLMDGFAESYATIEQTDMFIDGRKSERNDLFYIEMQDSDLFRDAGWHLEQEVSSGLWLQTDQVYSDRGDAIIAAIHLENNFGNAFRVKEDYELYES